ncbi:hypothetical protein MRS44_008733 [Fusarium solani]|uniref:uncharacterized protein n=1 Tax=Fusarium solani TaxID=169388 RepID=UPI0032C3EDAC|nr:hypothetical protein MRS44_008733 [Fusarium solani]
MSPPISPGAVYPAPSSIIPGLEHHREQGVPSALPQSATAVPHRPRAFAVRHLPTAASSPASGTLRPFPYLSRLEDGTTARPYCVDYTVLIGSDKPQKDPIESPKSLVLLRVEVHSPLADSLLVRSFIRTLAQLAQLNLVARFPAAGLVCPPPSVGREFSPPSQLLLCDCT